MPFGAAACLISEAGHDVERGTEQVELMAGAFRGESRRLLLHPYPKRGLGQNPPRAGFPIRPPLNQDPKTPEEEFAAETLRRMNEVLARIQELEDALLVYRGGFGPVDIFGAQVGNRRKDVERLGPFRRDAGIGDGRHVQVE